MSEENKKVEQIEKEEKASEVSDQDLENAAGGAANKTDSLYPCGCSIGGKDWGK